MPNRLANDGEGCKGGGLHSVASIMTKRIFRKRRATREKTLISFVMKLRGGGGSVTQEYYRGTTRIPGEVRIEMRTPVVSYSGKIGSERLGGR